MKDGRERLRSLACADGGKTNDASGKDGRSARRRAQRHGARRRGKRRPRNDGRDERENEDIRYGRRGRGGREARGTDADLARRVTAVRGLVERMHRGKCLHGGEAANKKRNGKRAPMARRPGTAITLCAAGHVFVFVFVKSREAYERVTALSLPLRRCFDGTVRMRLARPDRSAIMPPIMKAQGRS